MPLKNLKATDTEIIDLSPLFVVNAPMKKNQESYSLSELFEILVWKSPIEEG